MLLLWILIAAISILPAHGADSCNYIRLDEAGGSMEHVSVRSQADFGVCFAETAVQAMDAFRFSHPKTEGSTNYSFQGSGFIAALETSKLLRDLKAYNDRLFKEGKMRFVPGQMMAQSVGGFKPDFSQFEGFDAGNTEQGGYVCKIFDPIQKKGLSRTFEGEEAGDYWSGTLKVLRTEWSLAYMQRHQQERVFSMPTARDTTTVPQRVDYLQDCLRRAGYQVERHEILDALLTDSREAVLTLITEKGSKTERMRLPKNVHCLTLPSDGGPSQLIAEIHSNFNQKTPAIQPLSASICSTFLMEGHAGDSKVSWRPGENIRIGNDCDHHALLIIGRRRNPKTGNCQFLLRNSWGPKPEGYASEWEPDNGSIWVDETALAKNIRALNILEETSGS